MDKGYNTLVTGHNLDDEAAALFGNILYWKDEYLWKKNVVLEGTDGHLSKKVKPLFLCSEREMAAYAIINNIDYIYEECPFSLKAKSLTYKAMLNKLEETSPGTKLQFIKGYLKTVKERREKGERKEGGLLRHAADTPPIGGVMQFLQDARKIPYRVPPFPLRNMARPALTPRSR